MPEHHPAEQERKMMKKLGFGYVYKHELCQYLYELVYKLYMQ
jgi:hypothetical protein